MKHDQTNDALIEKLIDDPDMGDWEGEEGQRTYVPNPAFFDKVEPMQLATYFADYGDGETFLRLP
jgi:hypothetical protein